MHTRSYIIAAENTPLPHSLLQLIDIDKEWHYACTAPNLLIIPSQDRLSSARLRIDMH